MGASTSLEIGKVPGNETKCKIKYCKKVPRSLVVLLWTIVVRSDVHHGVRVG